MARDNMGGRLIVTQKALHEATAIRIAAQQGLNGSRSIRRTPTQTRTSQYVDQMRHQCVTGRALVALQYRARAPRDLTNSIVLANVCSGGDCSHLRVACLADRASSNARFVFSVSAWPRRGGGGLRAPPRHMSPRGPREARPCPPHLGLHG